MVVYALTTFSLSFGKIPISSANVCNNIDNNGGYLTAFAGAMAAGKSDELMRWISIMKVAQCKIYVCKPATDTRSNSSLTSRRENKNPVEAHLITNPQDILNAYNREKFDYLFIDEAQFLPKHPTIEVIDSLLQKGVKIYIAGLDKDFRGKPFQGCMPYLLAIADKVEKSEAVCSVCHKLNGTMTQRLINGEPAHKDDPTVVVDDGSKKEVIYEPRCRGCHQLPD